MRVAYVSAHDPADVRLWSGLVYHIRQAVARQPGVDLVSVGPLREWLLPAVRARQAWYRVAHGQRHVREQDPWTLAASGVQARRAVRDLRPDVVLAPGYHPVVGLAPGLPIVTYTDATFADIENVYPEYSGLSRASSRHGHALARAAAERFAMLCFAAEHAARSAVEVYGADPARVRVIPFGANLDHVPTTADAQAMIEAREARRAAGHPVRLLFLGVDWHRKGGPLAVEVVRRIRAAGVAAELDVVGCTPGDALPSWVHVRGFLSKATSEGQTRLKTLLAEAHLLLLPTEAESFGVVFCEASAFAIPSLARRVGGVPVWDGQNGYAFAPEVGPEPYADVVCRLLAEPGAYAALAERARQTYNARLNWDVAGAALVSALAEAIRLGPPR